MKLSEIQLNKAELIFEKLKNENADLAFRHVEEIIKDTNNLKLYPQDVYSSDEITDLLDMFQKLLSHSQPVFDNDSQTIRIIYAVLNYLNTGI